MLFSRWLGQQTKRPSQSRKPRSRRLTLEHLETRLVPTTFTWTNPNGGSFSNGANWQGGVAPSGNNAGDTLVFSAVNSAGVNVVNNLTNLTVAEIQILAPNYSISGAALTLTGSAGVGIDDESGSTPTIATPITLANSLSISTNSTVMTISGAISGPSDLTTTGPGTIEFQQHNTYTGSTILNAGEIKLGVANGLPAGTALTVDPHSTLDLNGFDHWHSQQHAGPSVPKAIHLPSER